MMYEDDVARQHRNAVVAFSCVVLMCMALLVSLVLVSP
jgi:hypothetical protein